jgi:hypothetical protein
MSAVWIQRGNFDCSHYSGDIYPAIILILATLLHFRNSVSLVRAAWSRGGGILKNFMAAKIYNTTFWITAAFNAV